MAWKVVPFSSMTTFFSSIVSVNCMIFGPCLVACSCSCTKGGATNSTFWRGNLRSSAALEGAGAARIRAVAAALSNAALRVNIGYLLDLRVFDYRRTLLFSPQLNLRCSKYLGLWKQPKESYVGQRNSIGDSTLTVSVAEIVMPSAIDQRPAFGADIRTIQRSSPIRSALTVTGAMPFSALLRVTDTASAASGASLTSSSWISISTGPARSGDTVT